MAQQKTEGKEKKKKEPVQDERVTLLIRQYCSPFFAYLPIFGLVMAFQDLNP
ncbi:MAG: hypothetical protein ACLUOI_25440 [Eisenbergiella sp.]